MPNFIPIVTFLLRKSRYKVFWMGEIVTRTNVACGNVSVVVVPCSYFGVPNYISIVTFLLKKVRLGFLVDVVLLMG